MIDINNLSKQNAEFLNAQLGGIGGNYLMALSISYILASLGRMGDI